MPRRNHDIACVQTWSCVLTLFSVAYTTSISGHQRALIEFLRMTAVTEQLNSLARSTVGTQADLFELSANENRLAIGLKSQILEVSGFPLSIGVDDDVVKVVPVALGLQKGPKSLPSSGAQ
jgi:hypothetical protein